MFASPPPTARALSMGRWTWDGKEAGVGVGTVKKWHLPGHLQVQTWTLENFFRYIIKNMILFLFWLTGFDSSMVWVLEGVVGKGSTEVSLLSVPLWGGFILSENLPSTCVKMTCTFLGTFMSSFFNFNFYILKFIFIVFFHCHFSPYALFHLHPSPFLPQSPHCCPCPWVPFASEGPVDSMLPLVCRDRTVLLLLLCLSPRSFSISLPADHWDPIAFPAHILKQEVKELPSSFPSTWPTSDP